MYLYNALARRVIVNFLIMLTLLFAGCRPIESSSTTQIITTPEANVTISPIPTLTTTNIRTSTSTPSPTPFASSTQSPTATKETTPRATISPLQKIAELPTSGSGLAISDDGLFVGITNANTGVLYVLDLKTQEVKWELTETSRTMTSYTALDFSPDNVLLAAGGVEQDVFIWDMTDGELTFRIPVPFQTVDQVSFSSDSQLLAVSSNDGLRIYSTETGELADTFPSPNIVTYPISNNGEHFLKPSQAARWFVGEAVFVPNHTNLLAITINSPYAEENDKVGALYFWDMESQELQEILTGAFGDMIAISPNGQLLIAEIDGQLRGWDILNGTELFIQYTEEMGSIQRIALANNSLLAMLNRDGVMTLWNLEQELLIILDSDKFVTDVLFTPDNDLLVAGFAGEGDVPVEIWKLAK